MPTNVQIPALGESVSEATLIKWHKNDGDLVKTDEPLCELETDKANVDVPSPTTGVLKRTKPEGAKVKIGDTIATIDAGGKASAPAKVTAAAQVPSASAPVAAPAKASATPAKASAPPPSKPPTTNDDLSPAVRRLVIENNLDASQIAASGPGGRITKEDVVKHMEARKPDDNGQPVQQMDDRATDADVGEAALVVASVPTPEGAVRRAPMSKIRKKIAERLVAAQHTAAILTTFNEIDLQNVIDLRTRFKEKFEKKHGVGLGFMSFFAKATVLALKEFERVNASIDGDDVIYHDYVHLGIAVSTERGLAVPVLRDAHKMSFAKIESEIKRLAAATRDGKLSLQELSGGTFTITNGGVFGSLLSTPILNPPQSGILGMHAIQKRPVAVNDKVEIRPMMYVALSYDHRLVDGKDSVSFLVRLKELLEDPARLMLEI
jgi:2-oxoglutarate dehydrogenase E2 component (dihydrolipoamide succinyltransferase)